MTSKTARKLAAGEKDAPAAAQRPIEIELEALLEWLKRSGTRETHEGMARYAIPSENAFGVTVAALRGKAKQLGLNHELAAALWATAWYEARLLAAFIDDPARVMASQMDRWPFFLIVPHATQRRKQRGVGIRVVKREKPLRLVRVVAGMVFLSVESVEVSNHPPFSVLPFFPSGGGAGEEFAEWRLRRFTALR